MDIPYNYTTYSTKHFLTALLIAVSAHLFAIIGINFSPESPKPIPEKIIEITLAKRPEPEKPESADFIAQANQKASGEQNKINPPEPESKTIASSSPIQEQSIVTTVESQPQPSPTLPKKARQILTTAKKSPHQAPEESSEQPKPTPKPAVPKTSLLARSLAITNLQADIENHHAAISNKPRIRRLTSSSTKKREDALYLEQWKQKVERVGNLNYPQQAMQNKIYGSLRLLVAIKPDGVIKSIEILQSSGHDLLDNAAINIVKLAAPFPPFPVEMKKNTDILEIIRTWKFEKRTYLD